METLPLKPFEAMTPADYEAIGLMCGLEVHQQLETPTKLFCRCPAGHYSNEFDAEVLRHMRPTLSEMGEYDGTALMEKKTRKNIVYRLHRDTVCTYEFDDTPPFPINDVAVDTALELALLLRLNLVNELHIARKQYLDGSIPAGFQRTTILGVDGWLPFDGRRLGVRQLGLEEDSCREVSDDGHDRVYLTDRLGTPLIEVVTEPDLHTPQETAEACMLIGRLCRSTQRVRRGYGATRQDVNVSVRGGTRIEIKGVPQIWRIPRLIYNEANRQVALLRIREVLHQRGITPQTFEASSEDVTAAVAGAEYAPVRTAIDRGLHVRCINLRGFGGLLNVMTQEFTTFAKEFSDRVRVIACLSELPNIAHSDAPSDSLRAQDWRAVRKRVDATDEDALIVVWGDERDARTACEEIEIRALEATEGVPSDTRQPMKDGTNGFERVLPGAERMYPDTDLPPIAIGPERVQRVRDRAPEFVWETEARFRNGGMVADDAERLAISPRAPLVTRAIETLDVSPMIVGVFVAQRLRALEREGLGPARLADDALFEVLSAHAKGKLAREGITWIAERLLERTIGAIEASHVAEALADVAPMDGASLLAAIDAAIDRARVREFRTPDQRVRWVTGAVMREVVGRVDGRIAHERVWARLSGAGAAASMAGEGVDG